MNGVLLQAPAVRIPGRAAVERAKIELERRLGPSKVLTSADACDPYATDESDVGGRVPDAVVIAECVVAEEIAGGADREAEGVIVAQAAICHPQNMLPRADRIPARTRVPGRQLRTSHLRPITYP